MSIKFKFMGAGLTQTKLAAEVEKRMKSDGLDMVCDRSCVSLTLSKKENGYRTTEKEEKVYMYLLDILEELEHGKAGA